MYYVPKWRCIRFGRGWLRTGWKLGGVQVDSQIQGYSGSRKEGMLPDTEVHWVGHWPGDSQIVGYQTTLWCTQVEQWSSGARSIGTGVNVVQRDTVVKTNFQLQRIAQ